MKLCGLCDVLPKMFWKLCAFCKTCQQVVNQGASVLLDKLCESIFTTVKASFTNTITIANSDLTKSFIVDCDASDFGIDSVLLQIVMDEVEQTA